MIRLTHYPLLCVVLSWLLTLGPAMSVAAARQEAPAPPANHVLDEANLFREHPGELAGLTATLKRIQEKHGYSVYLAVYYNVLEGSVQSRADDLYQSWLGDDKRGLVLVVQKDPAVDGKNIAVSYYRTSGLAEDAALQLIPDQKMANLITAVVGPSEGEKQFTAARVGSLVTGIEKEMDGYYAVEPSAWSEAGNFKIMAIFLAALALVALVGTFLWRHFTRVAVKSNHRYYFPEVKVAQRLGAPYGGGWVSEAGFDPASSRK